MAVRIEASALRISLEVSAERVSRAYAERWQFFIRVRVEQEEQRPAPGKRWFCTSVMRPELHAGQRW